MAAGVVRLADVVVPAIFDPYVQQLTQEKSNLIRSGAVVVSPQLSADLSGAGGTFNVPSFKDLDNDAENVASDDPSVLSAPNKIGTATEIQVRLSRNNSWSSMDITSDLLGKDPLAVIANRVSDYWTRRLQGVFVSTVKGVFADNDAAPSGSEHTRYDLTFNASGASFVQGVTNFTAEAFVDATATLGDSMGAVNLMLVHSIVYARMLKNDLIDVVKDSVSGQAISYFMGRTVVVDDSMPFTNGVFETWLFGAQAIVMGMGAAKVPSEVIRVPGAGNGSGQEVMHSRVEWAIHPAGHQYTPAYTVGGPTNALLETATTFKRVFSERKQIRIARLKTREF